MAFISKDAPAAQDTKRVAPSPHGLTQETPPGRPRVSPPRAVAVRPESKQQGAGSARPEADGRDEAPVASLQETPRTEAPTKKQTNDVEAPPRAQGVAPVAVQPGVIKKPGAKVEPAAKEKARTLEVTGRDQATSSRQMSQEEARGGLKVRDQEGRERPGKGRVGDRRRKEEVEAPIRQFDKDLLLKFIKEEEKGGAAKEPLKLSIWDFGGQSLFYSLHLIFLTRFGVYSITFNMCDLVLPNLALSTFLEPNLSGRLTEGSTSNPGVDSGEGDSPHCDQIHQVLPQPDPRAFGSSHQTQSQGSNVNITRWTRFWLQSVWAYTSGATTHAAPIFLVGTHKDMLPSPAHHEEISKLLFKEFSDSPAWATVVECAEGKGPKGDGVLWFFPVRPLSLRHFVPAISLIPHFLMPRPQNHTFDMILVKYFMWCVQGEPQRTGLL